MSEENMEGKAEETTAAEEKPAVEESANVQEEETREEQEAREAHKEKSKLGRKVAMMELRQAEILDRLDQIYDMNVMKETSNVTLDPEAPLDVATYQQLKKMETIEQTKQQQKYGKEYIRTLQEIGADADDPEIHLKVVEMVTKDGSEFNVRSHDDPSKAAAKNYARALKSVIAEPKLRPNLKQDKNLPPAGNPSKTDVKEEEEVVLSKEALAYAEARGMSPERIKKLLSRKDPIYAGGKII